MNLSGLATVAQLVTNTVSIVKSVKDASETSDNVELKSAVNQLNNSVIELGQRLIESDQENRKLKARLSLRKKVIGPHGEFGYFFYKAKPDQPLCPRCIQGESERAVFLSPPRKGDGGSTIRVCEVCDRSYTEKVPAPVGPAIAVGQMSITERAQGYFR